MGNCIKRGGLVGRSSLVFVLIWSSCTHFCMAFHPVILYRPWGGSLWYRELTVLPERTRVSQYPTDVLQYLLEVADRVR